jgi:hypothetical protein
MNIEGWSIRADNTALACCLHRNMVSSPMRLSANYEADNNHTARALVTECFNSIVTLSSFT